MISGTIFIVLFQSGEASTVEENKDTHTHTHTHTHTETSQYDNSFRHERVKNPLVELSS